MWEIWVVCPCKWRVCKINLLLQFCDFDLVWKRYFPTYHLRLCWSITMHSVHRILEKPIHIHFLNCLYLFRLLSFQIFVLRLNGNGPLNRARHKHISKFSTFWNSKKKEICNIRTQDFCAELNDKHIDEIDFTCTSLRDGLIPTVPTLWWLCMYDCNFSKRIEE